MTKKLNVLDLFCGAGGFSKGFKDAGFNIAAGIDNDKDAIATFAHNFPNSHAFQIDLSQEDAIKNVQTKITEKIDVVIGGPPCQGFSVAGKRLKDDPRNRLYKAYLNFLDCYNPKFVIIENVPAILQLHGGRIAKEIIKDLSEKKYEISVLKLNAADYGVPQSRKRVFFVCVKNGTVGQFIEPPPTTKFSPITSSDAISDLPLLDDDIELEASEYLSSPRNDFQKLMRGRCKKLQNHWAVEHKEETKKIIALVPDGGNYKALPEHLRATRKVNIAWTRLNSRKPSFTIDAGHNHHFHYSANRVPTVRECARIQSFPDDFVFLGGKVSQFRQVGNAVPPRLAEKIAAELLRVFSLE